MQATERRYDQASPTTVGEAPAPALIPVEEFLAQGEEEE